MMSLSWIQVIVLAVVQGVTEFLPISSSAHLILFSKLFGWPDQGLSFDMAVHAGSMVAVIVYLRRDLLDIVRGGLRLAGATSVPGRLAWPLVIATLPVAVAGLLMQDWVATTGRSTWVLGTTSLVFALLLWGADKLGSRNRSFSEATWRDTLWMGLAQASALIPGTSRSGVTMTAGLATGLDRRAAARLSFLLSVPVGLLVAAKDLVDLRHGVDSGVMQLIVGFWVSAVTAFVAIDALLRWLRKRGMMPFVLYRILLGLFLLAEASGWLSFFGTKAAG